MKKLVIACSLVLLIMGMFSVAAPHAHAQTLHPLVNAHTQIWLTNVTCYGNTNPCDGYAPPPLANCDGIQDTLGTAPVKDHLGYQLGTLYLFGSSWFGGCGSVWGGLKIDHSGIQLTGMSMQENGHSDNSREGSLDTLPMTLNAGHWESTAMVDNEAILPPYPCYTVGIAYEDEYYWTMTQVWVPNYCGTN